jgi:hypothetical protein
MYDKNDIMYDIIHTLWHRYVLGESGLPLHCLQSKIAEFQIAWYIPRIKYIPGIYPKNLDVI